VAIHTVVKKQPKADVVCDPRWQPPASAADGRAAGTPAAEASANCPANELLPKRTVLFADDSVAELLEPRLAGHSQVVRVLFSRAR
jgi:hypothetical protein